MSTIADNEIRYEDVGYDKATDQKKRRYVGIRTLEGDFDLKYGWDEDESVWVLHSSGHSTSTHPNVSSQEVVPSPDVLQWVANYIRENHNEAVR